jgi:hypothetical protein
MEYQSKKNQRCHCPTRSGLPLHTLFGAIQKVRKFLDPPYKTGASRGMTGFRGNSSTLIEKI